GWRPTITAAAGVHGPRVGSASEPERAALSGGGNGHPPVGAPVAPPSTLASLACLPPRGSGPTDLLVSTERRKGRRGPVLGRQSQTRRPVLRQRGRTRGRADRSVETGDCV